MLRYMELGDYADRIEKAALSTIAEGRVSDAFSSLIVELVTGTIDYSFEIKITVTEPPLLGKVFTQSCFTDFHEVLIFIIPNFQHI